MGELNFTTEITEFVFSGVYLRLVILDYWQLSLCDLCALCGDNTSVGRAGDAGMEPCDMTVWEERMK